MYAMLCYHDVVCFGAWRLGFQHLFSVVVGTKYETVVRLNEDNISLQDSMSKILKEKKDMCVEDTRDKMLLKWNIMKDDCDSMGFSILKYLECVVVNLE